MMRHQRTDVEFQTLRKRGDIEASRLIGSLPSPSETKELLEVKSKCALLLERLEGLRRESESLAAKRLNLIEQLAESVSTADEKTAKTLRLQLKASRDEAAELEEAGPMIQNALAGIREQFAALWKQSCNSVAPTYTAALRKAEQTLAESEERYIISQQVVARLQSAASSLSYRADNPPRIAGSNGHVRGGGR